MINEIKKKDNGHRIVSLLPSSTEIVCAIGLEENLVGRSHECDYPHSIKNLPVCTEPKFNHHGTSRQINTDVKNILKKAISIYNVKEEKLKELKPDFILTQSQCEVCAVSLKDVEKAVNNLVNSNTKIISLEPKTIQDVLDDILRVSRVLGTLEKGEKVVKSLEKRLNNISEKTYALKTKPTVFCIEWIDPLMASGNWVPELVEIAGAKNLSGEHSKHSKWIYFNDITSLNPDIIVVMPCGFNIKKTREEIHTLTENPLWSKLKAAASNKVFLVDGNQYFNRPGPRLVDSLEILCEIFHPELFNFGYKGLGWGLL